MWFLILKVEDIREVENISDLNNEIEKIVRNKTNEQLNQFSNIYFNKVKNALNILKKLHKDKGKSTKAETKKAAKVDSAALFEQAMASGTSNDEDEEKNKREKKHGKRLEVYSTPQDRDEHGNGKDRITNQELYKVDAENHSEHY